MPYNTNDDLPESVKNHLPEAAQTIYRKAFNAAYEEYQDPSKRRSPEDSLDKAAAQVAWHAVKQHFVKDEKTGHWKPK